MQPQLQRPTWMVALVAIVVLVPACANDKPRTAPPTTIATAEGLPAEILADRSGWVLPGHDYDNSRATFTSAIDSTNVGGLTEAWTLPVDGPLTTVPLIVDGTVFVQDGSGVVRAADLETGRLR